MYDTGINIIAGIPDLNLVIDVIGYYAQGKGREYVIDKVFEQNIYAIRTNKSRGRFLRAINAAFLKFLNADHKTIIFVLFRQEKLLHIKRFALYIQFAVNNALFFELSKNVFLKIYHSGRSSINNTDLVSYLYHIREKDPEIQQWSDSTVKKVASKYLTFLKKMDFLRGAAKKEFTRFVPDDVTIVYTIYLIKALGQSSSNILKDPYIPLLMLGEADLMERIKKISLKDYFSVSTVGHDMNIDLKYPFGEIADVIAKEYRPEAY
ncbi:DUF1819 family protein [bacterium]|nr:DUF1819 family protein [bacterium]